MNIAIIFAGGVGTRMNSKALPKQFLEVYGKPIIIYTLEIFEKHPEIDGIIIACHEEWMEYLEKLIYRFRIEKVLGITKGGNTGQLSIYNALILAREKAGIDNIIVLIHDGVRPLINEKVISDNIAGVKQNGNAITVSKATETFAIVENTEQVGQILDRSVSRIAKAPQSFYLKDILAVHMEALKDGLYDTIDSCTLMHLYHKKLFTVEGPYTNIKVTTQEDFHMFRALQEDRENRQLFTE